MNRNPHVSSIVVAWCLLWLPAGFISYRCFQICLVSTTVYCRTAAFVFLVTFAAYFVLAFFAVDWLAAGIVRSAMLLRLFLAKSAAHLFSLSLQEVALVVGISAALSGLVCVSGLHAKRATMERQTQAEVAQLARAILMYEAKHHAFPLDLDKDAFTSSDEIIAQLKNSGVLSDDFEPSDPWGRSYVIILKRDYPQSPDAMYDTNLMPLNDTPDGFQVYSKGPDGKSAPDSTATESRDNIGNFSG